MINVCIMDSDKKCREQIARIVNSFFKYHSMSVEIDLYDSRLRLKPELWGECAYDLALIDITSAESRLDILKYSKSIRKYCLNVKIIFMSDDVMAALDVFNYSPDYFIYKSEINSRLRSAMEYLFNLEKWKDDNSIIIGSKSKKYIIPMDSIIYFEHYQHDTKVVCEDKEIICHEKLSDLHGRLDTSKFLRCHCSFLVNVRYIDEFNRTQLLLTNGKRIPCSRANAKYVEEAVTNLYKK